jgi:allantoate deiminase
VTLEHCRKIAEFSEEPGTITRTFLSAPMRDCLAYLMAWADRIGMSNPHVDAAGNFRALLPGTNRKRLVIASHIDTVPNAGAFDGVLGVVMGMVIAESYRSRPPACTLEVVGFSEEEGVRFARPFIGSTAYVTGLDHSFLHLSDENGVTVQQAMEAFGLDAASATTPQMDEAAAYLEFHIEQGPVLESLGLPLGIVEAIAGQTRATVEFTGSANHAGTTPMNLRHDAFCAAAEWALFVEQTAQKCPGLVATVGSVHVTPGAVNVVPGRAALSLDLRHANDEVRLRAFDDLMQSAEQIAARRRLRFASKIRLQQPAVPMDSALTDRVERAVAAAGVKPHRMTSGAGHDAMIVAKHIPAAMLFLRSPNGISHHPDETVLSEDVELALTAGKYFVETFV